MRALLRRLGEEDAVVRDDPHRIALDSRPATDERLTVELLELVEARAVDDPGDHLARVDLRSVIDGDQAVEIGRIGDRRLGLGDLPRAQRRRGVQVAHDLAGDRERVLVGGRVVISDARLPCVDVGAPELLAGHLLPGRRLHERRAADEDRAGAAHDHGLVAHRRDVGPAGGAEAHHRRDLRNAPR